MTDHEHPDEPRITPAGALRATAIDYANSADENPYITEKLLNAADQIEALTARIAAAEAASVMDRFHDEQKDIWAQEILESLSCFNLLRIGDYEDKITAHDLVRGELSKIAETLALADRSALDEALAAEREKCAKTIRNFRATINFEALIRVMKDEPLQAKIVDAVSDILDAIADCIEEKK